MKATIFLFGLYRSCFLLVLMLSAELLLPAVHAQSVPPVVSRILLPNGVRLLLKPEADTNRVVISLFVRMEADSSSGAAVGEMVARTLFYGNANRTQNGILTLAGQTGGSLDVLRTKEYVAITYVIAPAQLPESAHLLCDCLKNAEFAPESLQRALQTLHEERRRRREDGFMLGYDALRQALGDPMPTESQLQRVTQAQAQNYFRRHYGPAKTVIAVVGHFNSVQVSNLFNGFLADYTRPLPARFTAFLDTPVAAGGIIPSVTLPAPSSAAYALAGAPAPSVRSPDYPAFTVLLSLLGGGHASRLFQQAREALGLGYEVGAICEADRDGPLVAFLQWNPQRSLPAFRDGAEATAKAVSQDVVLKLLHKQIDDLIANPPSHAELDRARNYAIGQDALRHERVRDRAFFLGWYETLDNGFGYDKELPQLLAAVTPADVQRVARTYLKMQADVLVAPILK